jgi:hypothetical protein
VKHGTDDAISRYQPKLIEINGVLLWVQPRYSMIYLSAGLGLPLFLVAYFVLHASLINTAFTVAAIVTPIAWKAVGLVEADRSLGGLWDEARAETRTWWRARLAAARHTVKNQPYRYAASRVRYSEDIPWT